MPSIFYTLVIKDAYYIESKCRFVVGLLYVIDMPSEEVDYLLPLQQAHYCYYSRLTVVIVAGSLSILLVAILLYSIRAILVGLLFNKELRLFRLDWPTSFSGFVLLRSTGVLRIAQIVPLVVSFSSAIALSELVSLSSSAHERNTSVFLKNRFSRGNRAVLAEIVLMANNMGGSC